MPRRNYLFFSSNDRNYEGYFHTCGGCIHVRTCTIIYGCFRIFMYLGMLMMLTVAMFQPNVFLRHSGESSNMLLTYNYATWAAAEKQLFPSSLKSSKLSSNETDSESDTHFPAFLEPSPRSSSSSSAHHPYQSFIQCLNHLKMTTFQSQQLKSDTADVDSERKQQINFKPYFRFYHRRAKTGDGDDTSATSKLSTASPTTGKLSPHRAHQLQNGAAATPLNSTRMQHQLNWKFFISAFYLVFSLLLVHGAITKTPNNVLPFFILQIFDFVISLLWVIGNVTNVARARQIVDNLRCMPWSRHLANISMNPVLLAITLMTICFLLLAVQGYLMGIVWSCYKYLVMLRLQQENSFRGCSSLGGSNNNSGSNNVGGGFVTDRFVLLLNWILRGGQYSRRNHNMAARGGSSNDTSITMPRGANGRGNTTRNTDAADPITCDDIAGFDLPKYEQTLTTPANAFMPPPYLTMPKAATDKK